MARHGLKATLLLIPSLATVVLLLYCMLSDTWIQIHTERLHNISILYENEFNVLKGNGLAADNTQQRAQTNRPNIEMLTKSTASTTVTVPSTTVTSGSVTESDNVYETEEQGQADEAGSEEYVDAGEIKEEEKPARAKRQTKTSFVFIKKLWPFSKFKGLYSECVSYTPLRLKISRSFLNMENKEPIVGSIDYMGNLNAARNAVDCDEKAGKISCLLSKKCVTGKSCDGVVNCDDQTDEQLCDSERVCNFQTGITGFKCDSRCWQYWNKCDQTPHCMDLSDEASNECAQPLKLHLAYFSSMASMNNLTAQIIKHDHYSFSFGSNHFETSTRCFKNYFNFKSPKLIPKDSLKYLNQMLADNIQEMNNINYQLQLIYTLSFVFSFIFALMALISLAFLSCFKKLCFQCPFWFYGFFQILCWLSCLVGLMTFFYQYYNSKQRMMDPSVQLPIVTELLRLNQELLTVEQLGISFWLAVAATCTSFLASLFSCLVCCRLPSSRHEDKEYKIMQLPAYN